MSNLDSICVFIVVGSRQARGEVGQQERVPGVQPRVPAAQGHQPRGHQELPEQGRRADGGGAAAHPGHHPELNEKHLFFNHSQLKIHK
jgi:hypothetical protein